MVLALDFVVVALLASASHADPQPSPTPAPTLAPPPAGTHCFSKSQCRRALKWWKKTLARKVKRSPGRYMNGFLHDSYFASCFGGAKKIAMVIPASTSCPSTVHTRRSTKAFRARAIRKQGFCKPAEYKVCSYCIQINVPPGRGVVIEALKESVLVKPEPCKLWDFPNTPGELAPAPAPPAWVYAELNQDCTTACSEIGKECDNAAFNQATDEIRSESDFKNLAEILGLDCPKGFIRDGFTDYEELPMVYNSLCNRAHNFGPVKCSPEQKSIDGGARRLCWCSEASE